MQETLQETLIFTNPGEIDPRLITTMGTNVKENPNAIGTFGTGLKYAIATVLRLGGQITITSGTGVLTFYTQPDTIRGKTFNFIHMAGYGNNLCTTHDQVLSFTTELGKNWQPWMAYREFYCNALDENGDVILTDNAQLKPQEGYTKVFVTCPQLTDAHRNSHNFLLNTKVEPLYKTPRLEIYLSGSYVGYYHGIKVLDLSRPGKFTYNILQPTQLTEDRTLSLYSFTSIITREILSRGAPTIPPDLLAKLIRPQKDTLEYDWHWPSYITPRQEILDAAHLSPRLKSAIQHYLPAPKITRSKFHDLDDDAPEIPPYTCAYINDLQQKLLNIAAGLYKAACLCENGLNQEQLAAICLKFSRDIEDLLNDHPGEPSALEQLRKVNVNLRDSGIYWRNACKELTQNIRSIYDTNKENSHVAQD